MFKITEVFTTPYRKTVLKGGKGAWIKIVIRPVVIREKNVWQFSYFDEKKDITKNYDADVAVSKLNQLIEQGYKIVAMEESGNLAHDKTKKYILPVHEKIEWLIKIGIQTEDGNIKADMRDKWEQINQFLKNLKEIWEQATEISTPVKIVDYGCGNAYLTFATAYFFKEIVHIPIELIGIDLNKELMERNNKIATELGWNEVKFVADSIENFEATSTIDIALSLHACDTASDRAMEKAVHAQAKMLLMAPCCHHNIQKQLKTITPFELIFTDGILKERLGDVLTDALRAGWLRTQGYKTDVVQFIDSKHTPKNLLIRAVKNNDIQRERYEKEYQQLKEYWNLK